MDNIQTITQINAVQNAPQPVDDIDAFSELGPQPARNPSLIEARKAEFEHDLGEADTAVQKGLDEQYEPTQVKEADRERLIARALRSSGIALSPDALQGLAGEVVRKILPETEAHPALLLTDFLVRFGAAAGRNWYVVADGAKHFPNLFAVFVGKSSKARKGTASQRSSELFNTVEAYAKQEKALLKDEQNPAMTRFQATERSGLSSGEGLIWNVRDRTFKNDGKVDDLGVLDKRLLIVESELGGALAAMMRDSNTLSSVLRNSWDSKEVLATLTSGRDRNKMPTVATKPHISVIGHITVQELRKKLSESDVFNGFGNRFLWVLGERWQLKPFGNHIDWKGEPEVARLHKAVVFAYNDGKPRRMFFDRNAAEMYKRFYHSTAEQKRHGFAEAMTSRAEPQVIRLAMIYALLDCSDHIRSEHLAAAIALWNYADQTALRIFGLSKTHKQTLQFLNQGPKTISKLREDFGRHRLAVDIETDLRELSALGYVREQRNPEGSRASAVWSITPAGAKALSEH